MSRREAMPGGAVRFRREVWPLERERATITIPRRLAPDIARGLLEERGDTGEAPKVKEISLCVQYGNDYLFPFETIRREERVYITAGAERFYQNDIESLRRHWTTRRVLIEDVATHPGASKEEIFRAGIRYGREWAERGERYGIYPAPRQLSREWACKEVQEMERVLSELERPPLRLEEERIKLTAKERGLLTRALIPARWDKDYAFSRYMAPVFVAQREARRCALRLMESLDDRIELSYRCRDSE